MAQLRSHEVDFQRLGARVVLVGLGTAPETGAFRERFDVPFPMIADPHGRLFRAFGLKRASPAALVSPRLVMKGLSAMARGHLAGAPTGDVLQLPGVFIIDTGGRIRFSHFSRDPSDHPSPETIMAAIQDLGLRMSPHGAAGLRR